MLKNIFLVLFLLFIRPPGLQSQEGLRPLSGNFSLMYPHLSTEAAVKHTNAAEARSAQPSLQLPFRDDFYYATTSHYPSPLLWADSMAYISVGFGIAPPSIGVATFDGLNKHGYPYKPDLINLNKSEPADTLTSNPIDLHVIAATSKTLQPSDSVGLMFFYQSPGNGESPEVADSLVLDLFKPRQNTWNREWFKRGKTSTTVHDTAFHKVLIRISDTAYFHDGFRFRFRNTATTSGNYDHWHVDYIYLNTQLYLNQVFDDITITHVPTPFLKDYSAMPWQQYNFTEMAEKISVRIRNNTKNILTMSYKHDVYNNAGGQLLHSYDGGPVNLMGFDTIGYSKHTQHSNPSIKANYTFADMSDSTDLKIKHYVYRAGNDFLLENDTVVQYQRFRNYFAFDDGSAETGYYVNGIGGTVVMKVRLNIPDTLRAVRIYFDPDGNVNSAYNFSIQVWAHGGSAPSNLIYSSPEMTVQYFQEGFKGVPEYTFAPVVFNPGTYYIGMRQSVATGITIGFDKNYDFSRNVYFNDGNGWKLSELNGSPMIRPVFGAYVPPPVGISEIQERKSDFRIYPNPSRGVFTIHPKNDQAFNYRLYNATGQPVTEEINALPGHSSGTDILPEGLYFIRITSEGKNSVQKIIIRR
jgi:hypothetical protein